MQTKYPRFAELTAAAKAQARQLWRQSEHSPKPPLVDCYFGLTRRGGSDAVEWIYWANPNVVQFTFGQPSVGRSFCATR